MAGPHCAAGSDLSAQRASALAQMGSGGCGLKWIAATPIAKSKATTKPTSSQRSGAPTSEMPVSWSAIAFHACQFGFFGWREIEGGGAGELRPRLALPCE